ncbi:MAG: WecB/TagA/CpsF family glycosyltransferase [Prolixibacteraceae bacterium]|jgi:N-acetylglucosaminyldiphosphoundecaprenol N-acetyl-beta-D-mannosaminyltransferase|nr:WecB/TagA/CpsF family glycosyltransferase [Prolixibacteraceae bacterium]MDD4755009.1 WecB/TagA/CpsF family glycosyltransferase [Prolixibacteraceae bacterium]NLO00741.1 WecB/TagA/CpsF family glycosyltransferase [Bacteroidales bacterium]
MNLHLSAINLFNGKLPGIPHKKLLINTVNAHSFNVAQKDPFYAKALLASDILLPDGISIVLAKKLLNRKMIKKIAGADLFHHEMKRLNEISGTCFFLGSNRRTLDRIIEQSQQEYPNVRVFTHSPPYSENFSPVDSQHMISVVNRCKPDVLFIGMTAPKQEKWAYEHFDKLEAGHICSIGAVFDIYAGNVKRAPLWMINSGLEWFYRLIKEPRRLWRRYLLGNFIFIGYIIREKAILKINKKQKTWFMYDYLL